MQPSSAPQIDPFKFQDFVRRMRDGQNLGLGFLGGLIGGLIGAILWAIITALSNYELGIMAIGVAFLVGFGVRTLGKGVDKTFGYLGAVLSLLSCAAGSFLAAVAIASRQQHVDFLFALARLTPHAFDILKDSFTFIDLIFYAVALYFGYRYSFRQITHAELANLT
ncbi:MAG TPA: hypothetical protein VN934_12470 [Candidatus Tumulicola sp.]|nr:hypothetical protein [Candidatus Tumulicola sp.]